jgi:hypothetical protein
VLRRARSAVAVAAVAAAVYARSVAFGFTELDDRDLIVGDAAFLGDPGSVWRAFGRSYLHVVDATHAYYRPLVTLSYVLDARAGGSQPAVYHATNVALHAIASVLFYALLRRLAICESIAVVAGVVFAVHPALVPAVAWIPGRNDTLLAVFVLASWLTFASAVQVGNTASASAGSARGWRLMIAHLVFFALALLTKETAAIVPLVCILHVALVDPQAWKRFRRPIGALVPLGWTAVLVGRFALGARGALPNLNGARTIAENLPLVVVSAGKLLLPSHLSPVGILDDQPLWPGLLGASAVFTATWLLPGVRRRVVALGAGAFVLFLAPLLFVPGSLVLDHRLVLPGCGAILALAEIARTPALERRVLLAFAGATLVALAIVTLGYEEAFRDRRAFAREAVASSPRSSLAHFCLGQSYQIDGAEDRALAEYRTALALGPAEVAHNNIAVIDMSRGLWDRAEDELRAELALNPRYSNAHGNLAIVLRHEERRDEACASAELAVHYDPDDEKWRRERETDCER